MASTQIQPQTAKTIETRKKKVALVPTMRRASGRSRAPTDCATRMVAAMPMPNTVPRIRNSTRLALEVAVSADSPRKRPTQTALIEPLSDCSTLEPSTGKANSSSVRGIGPLVRSPVRRRVGIFSVHGWQLGEACLESGPR